MACRARWKRAPIHGAVQPEQTTPHFVVQLPTDAHVRADGSLERVDVRSGAATSGARHDGRNFRRSGAGRTTLPRDSRDS